MNENVNVFETIDYLYRKINNSKKNYGSSLKIYKKKYIIIFFLHFVIFSQLKKFFILKK